MRNKELDRKYIVDLSQQLVGEKVIAQLRKEGQGVDGRMLFEMLRHTICGKVSKMTGEKLGQICEYGSLYGLDIVKSKRRPGQFLNLTGFKSVLSDKQGIAMQNDSPREVMELWVTAIVVCFVRDILLQERYLQDEVKLDEEILEQSRVDGQIDFWRNQRRDGRFC